MKKALLPLALLPLAALPKANTDAKLVAGLLSDVLSIEQVHPDSIVPYTARIEAWLSGTDDSEARIVGATALGRLYNERARQAHYAGATDYEQRSLQCFAFALGNLDAAHGIKANKWVPVTLRGKDSERYFDGDMLHVVWRTMLDNTTTATRDTAQALPHYANLIDFYTAKGNSEAALLLELDSIDATALSPEARREALQSICSRYEGTPLCAEAWLALSATDGLTAEERYDCLSHGIELYPKYRRISALHIALTALSDPTIDIAGPAVAYPSKPCPFTIEARNVQAVWCGGSLHELDMRSAIETACDTLSWDTPAKPGVYTVSFTPVLATKTVKKPEAIEREVLVTRLKVLYNSLPERRLRVTVVDSETGKPVEGARVELFEEGIDSVAYATVATNERGQALVGNGSNTSLRVRVSTDDEGGRPIERLRYTNYWQDTSAEELSRTALFTDRSIYRPGQTVKVAGIAYSQREWEASVASGRTVALTLRDASRKVVERATLTCDSMGVFTTEFLLPEACTTGSWSLRPDTGAGITFRVEEYRRPTFTIELADTLALSSDSLTVSGQVVRYDGAVMRASKVSGEWSSLQWRLPMSQMAGTLDTLLTDEQGRFSFTVKRDTLAMGLRVSIAALSEYGEQESVVHSYSLPGSFPSTAQPTPADPAFFFECQRDTFDTDSPALISLASSFDDISLYYTLSANGTTFTDTLLCLKGDTLRLSIPYKESYGTAAVASFCFVKAGKMYARSQYLPLRKPDTRLRVKWLTFRDKAQPGSSQQWTLSLSKPDGTPASPANLLLSLYDASLDHLAPNAWSLNVTRNNRYYAVPYSQTSDYTLLSRSYLAYRQKRRKESNLTFCSLNDELFGKPAIMLTMSARAQTASTLNEEDATGTSEEQGIDTALPALRQDFCETAFFMPSLRTDSKGEASIAFTLPESLTTWRLLAVTHTPDMQTASLDTLLTAQKDLMAELHLPRFIRPGDTASLTATVTNTTDSPAIGKAQLLVLDASTLTTLQAYAASLSLPATADTTSSFPVTASTDGDILVRFTAETPNGGDGEQRSLPSLPALEPISNTLALTAKGQGASEWSLESLFPDSSSNRKLTVEYTTHPEQYALQNHPPHASTTASDALSLASALYAQELAKALAVPLASDPSLLSRLKALQQADGSLSWYPSMPGNDYITRETALLFCRLKALTGSCPDTALLSQATHSLLRPSPLPDQATTASLQTLYIALSSATQLSPQETLKADTLLRLALNLDKQTASPEDLALASLALLAKGNRAQAQAMADAIASRLVRTDSAGTYIEQPQGPYASVDRKLQAHVQIMEALQALNPSDPDLDGLRSHLLRQKRTQAWDTPVTSASAIFALLNAPAPATATQPAADVLTVSYDQSSVLNIVAPADSLGYATDSLAAPQSLESLRLQKYSQGESWVSLHADFLQPYTLAQGNAEGLSVASEMPASPVRTGQRVRVVHSLTADRDYDFVTLTLPRPAAFEPVSTLSSSGRADGIAYYREVRDTHSDYHIQSLPRGHYQIVEEFYVERAGDYHTGIATVRCEYAPEFSGHSSDAALTVE